MIDIIGNIKVDETNPQRVKQFIACICSYAFLGENATMKIHLESCSDPLAIWLHDTLKQLPFRAEIVASIQNEYGLYYRSMLEFDCRNEFVLNFMEDQFMMLDNERTLMHLIGFMKQYKADVCKASFNQVEQNSIGGIKPVADIAGLAMIFDNTEQNHEAYCSHYTNRYYIGCNFLTTREFALKFWDRQLGPKPHPYEVANWSPAWQHRCVIPHIELQAAIDDDHGEPGSSLLQRPDAKKFWDIYNTL